MKCVNSELKKKQGKKYTNSGIVGSNYTHQFPVILTDLIVVFMDLLLSDVIFQSFL